MNHCCDILKSYSTHKNNLIEFLPETRSYYFVLHDDQHGTHQKMFYCPWCGTSLPKDLSESLALVLQKEYGIEDVIFDREKIPPEFKTDEWWKKRGL
jgi:hypothetical protein